MLSSPKYWGVKQMELFETLNEGEIIKINPILLRRNGALKFAHYILP